MAKMAYENGKFRLFRVYLRESALNKSFRRGFGLLETVEKRGASSSVGCFFEFWIMPIPTAIFSALKAPIWKNSTLTNSMTSKVNFLFPLVSLIRYFTCSNSIFVRGNFQKFELWFHEKKFQIGEKFRNYHTV